MLGLSPVSFAEINNIGCEWETRGQFFRKLIFIQKHSDITNLGESVFQSLKYNSLIINVNLLYPRS